MATSDAPLNVPNVTLAVARGASSPPPEPGNALFFDDFESYTDGQDLSGLNGYPNSMVRSTADATHAKTGTKSGRIDFVAGGTAGGIVRSITNLVKGQEVWVQFWARFDIGWLFNSGAGFKFFRMQVFDSGGSSLGYLDWYNASDTRPQTSSAWYFRYEGAPTPNPNAYFGNISSENIDPGSWHKYELYYYLDNVDQASGGNAVVRFWRDNALIGERTDKQTLTNATDEVRLFRHCTFFNPSPSSESFNPVTSAVASNVSAGGGSPQDQGYNIDDFVLFTSDSPPTNTDAAGNVFIGGG